jgi:mRNA-degrading endonuclease RelE of RelBE toxin-antitoxin system
MLDRAGLVTWQIVYTRQAQKDAKKLAAAGFRNKVDELLKILSENPYQRLPRLRSWWAILRVHTRGESTFSIVLSIKSTRVRS